MPLILGTNSIKDTGYDVDNSLRFEAANGDYIRRENTGTDFSASGSKLFTYSVWVKRAKLGSFQQIYAIGSGGGRDYTAFDSSDRIEFAQYNSGFNYRLITNRVFRDSSAWYHLVFAVDTTNGTANNRARLYVNGVEETSFSTRTNASSSQAIFPNTQCDSYVLGADTDFNNDFSGYFSEACFISDLQLDPTSFGEFDEDSGIWKPKKITATFSNDSFYYEFKNSSAVGTDTSGLGNNAGTINGLTAVDQSTDTCTNNFATMNSLANKVTSVTFSEGNLKTNFANGRGGSSSTFGLTTGKWYVEMNITTMPADERFHLGVVPFEVQVADDIHNTSNQGIDLSGFNAVIYADSGSGGAVLDNFFGNNTTRFDSFTGIIGMALDMTNGTIAFSKAGAWVTGSGTTDTDFSNALKVNISTPLARHDVWHVACGTGNSSGTSGVFEMNFGSPSFAISSGNADGNGYGNFEYAVPANYYSLNTKNLAEYG